MKIKIINKRLILNKRETIISISKNFKLVLLIANLICNYIFTKNSIKFKIYSYYKKRIKYLNKFNITYNESNLMTFQDKLNWLIIHDTNELKVKCSDKLLLHEYSKRKLGKDICNKILKVYNNTEEIQIKDLPDRFVLKANHGSAFNIIINNKSNLDFIYVKRNLNKWLNIDYGEYGAEFHYSFIKRKIFAEEFIGNNLKNYKFLCYIGKSKYVYLSITINNKKYRNFYDMEWNFLNFHCLSEPFLAKNFSKPNNFSLMKKYANILSKDFLFVRVDFYELKNEIRLGELTFTPMNSFFYCKNKSHEIELGKEIKIT